MSTPKLTITPADKNQTNKTVCREILRVKADNTQVSRSRYAEISQ